MKKISSKLSDIESSKTEAKTWQFQIEEATKMKSIDYKEKKKWVAALEFLRTLMGESFLKDQNTSHPIYNLVVNRAWNEVILLASNLKRLEKRGCDYPNLLNRIRKPEKCRTEGMPFIDIASNYFPTALVMKFLREEKTMKTPDIELSNPVNREKIFIEVSGLKSSNKRIELDINYKRIYNQLNFIFPSAIYACFQLKYIPNTDIKLVLDRIQALKEAVYQNKDFRNYKDEYIDLALCHGDKFVEFEEWRKANNKPKGLHGPPLNSLLNETYRIENNKLEKKISQLPKNYPGIIYIPLPDNPFYLHLITEEDIASIENRIQPYPQVLGVVIYSHLGSQIEESSAIFNGHFRGIKMITKTTTRCLLFIYNHRCKTIPSEDTMKWIYKSFL